MFSLFFIQRPIFATVISILITLAGAIAFFQLPISMYPDITPPVVRVAATYPGASAQVVADTVAASIEQEVNGVEGMLYMQSTSASDGSYSLDVTFELGTDVDLATVLTQNRVNIAEAKLPEEVKQQGITTKKQSTALIAILNVFSPDNQYDELFLVNYVTLNIKDELSRVKGVGAVNVYPAKEYGMRIWLDPEKLKARGLTTTDVVQAIREQNVQVAAGQIGQPPAPEGLDFQLTVNTLGRLTEAEQFENIIVKTDPIANTQGGRVTRVKDVARVELGAKSYSDSSTLNGKSAASLLIYQAPGSNAVQVAHDVQAVMENLKGFFPQGLDYQMTYDYAEFVVESIHEVYKTLFEAFVLVFIVVLVFLHNWRATLIPSLTIPVALVGTFAVMLAFGFSLNTLTLFGLVLAIGIVVDDAILVVENVERNMHLYHLPPKEATARAMGEVFGPIIATSLVLMAVFLPSALLPGVTGQLFLQFALTIAVSTLLSTINALTLSPALCGMILKPVAHKNVFARLFDSAFDRLTALYSYLVRFSLKPLWIGFFIAAFGGALGLTYWVATSVPTGFLPPEDQGILFFDAQLPDGASLARTEAVMKQTGALAEKLPGVADVITLPGFSMLGGAGSNKGLGIALLKPSEERPDVDVVQVIGALRKQLQAVQEAQVFVFTLPAIIGLGNTGGFDLRLQDRAGLGREALQQATQEVTAAANSQSQLQAVYSTYRAGVPQLFLDIDRVKVKQLDVPLQTVFDTLQAFLGSTYVNDFNLYGRTFQVKVQAESQFRAHPEDIVKLEMRNRSGQVIPLGSVLTVKEDFGPEQVTRYNLYPASTINGNAAPGVSSGQALTIMEELTRANLPQGMGYAWSSMSYQEKQSGGQGNIAFILGLIVVYLILAAQYESWSLPLPVVLSVPLAVLGAMSFLLYFGMDNNLFTQVGLVLLIALAAKNAILIVEFARENRAHGKTLVESAVTAAQTRLRPILMTSFAFVFGVLPLMLSTGAGSGSRQALGTVVFGGMIGGTLLGLLFTPLLYVVVQGIAERFGGAKADQTMNREEPADQTASVNHPV